MSTPLDAALEDQAAAAGHARLRVALLALLPKDGTPMSVKALADAACVSKGAVTDALFDDYMAHRIDFDHLTDLYSAVRQGDRL